MKLCALDEGAYLLAAFDAPLLVYHRWMEILIANADLRLH